MRTRLFFTMLLIVRYPREITAGSVNASLCSNVDFAPTLLGFAGTEEIEYYDLAKAPLQTHSVHADPAYAERIAETQKLLAGTIQEVDIQASELPSTHKQNDGNPKNKNDDQEKEPTLRTIR